MLFDSLRSVIITVYTAAIGDPKLIDFLIFSEIVCVLT